MNHKKELLVIFSIFCIFLCISSVSASDGNVTSDVTSQDVTSQDLSAAQGLDNQSLLETDDELLTASGTVYFDASASSDGDGSISKPYNKFYTYRVSNGQTAYFADGIYEYQYTYGVDGGNTKFIGQSSKAIFKSTSTNKFTFTVNPYYKLYFENITLDNVHIYNQGTLTATNTAFQNSVGFSGYYAPEIENEDLYFDSSYGGVIISNSPDDSLNYVNLNNCIFTNNVALNGGVIGCNNTRLDIRGCEFYNSQASKYGGSVYAAYSYVSIISSYFSNSSAVHGGTIYCVDSYLNLQDSNVYGSTSSSFGGAIALRASDLDMKSCNFRYCNSLGGEGGSVYAEKGNISMSSCEFKDGRAFYGGAICSLMVDLTLSYCSFSDNYAGYGGSVYQMYKTLNIDHAKFINSRAYYGGAIYAAFLDSIKNNSTATFTNSTAQKGVNFYIMTHEDEFTRYDIGDNLVTPIISPVPTSQGALPSKYDSRDYGYITPVKNQGYSGSCWAFAGLATLEACLKKATGITYDFSEQNLKNLMTWYSKFGRFSDPEDGGFEPMVFSYLTSWLGPINDSDDEFDDFSYLSEIYNPLIKVPNIYCLPIRKDTSDNDAIKRAIMDYGAVAVGLKFITGNHAVTLVGWDDNYNGYDYNKSYTKGAWIFKNSWGDNWKDEGFGYMAYDRIFNSELGSRSNYAYTFIFNATEDYVRNYQYDIYGVNDPYETSENSVMYKNVFWAIDNENLAAVSTFFKNPTDYTVFIYHKNSLVLTQNGHSDSGYYTIPLNKKISLSKGDEFSVVFRIDNAGVKYIPLAYGDYATRVLGTEGISFFYDGKQWLDLFTDWVNGTKHIACIKAFTTPVNVEKVTISTTQFSSVYLNEEISINIKFSNSQINGGFVNFVINGKKYNALVENGQACLKVSFNETGSYELSAQYKNNIYESNIIKFNFNVIKEESIIEITAGNVLKYYGGSEKLNIKVTKNGAALSGVNVRISIANETHIVTTGSTGQASVDLNLPVGTYEAIVEYGGKSVSSSVTVRTTIDASDMTGTYPSPMVSAVFLDSKGAALSNKEVIFEISGVSFSAYSDSNGLASLTLKNYSPRTYVIVAKNSVTGEQKKFRLTINKANPTISVSTSTDGNTATITASLNSDAAGDVIFTVGNTAYTRAINNGVASLTLSNLESATYSVYATYNGDTKYNPALTSTFYFTISTEAVITILAPDSSIYYGGSYDVTVYKNNLKVTYESVNLTVGSHVYNFNTDGDGVLSVIVSLTPGTYDFIYEYGGVSVTPKVTVKSTIIASDMTGTYQSSKVSAKFLDLNGAALSKSTVKFNVDGTVYETNTDNNGFASVDVDLGPGTYDVYAINSITEEISEFQLTINKATPTISITSSVIGNSATIKATLSQGVTGNVVFTVGDKTYTRSISNGVATLSLSDLSSATYSAYAKYAGNANFSSVTSSTTKFTVSTQAKIALDAPGFSMYYGKFDKFNVTVLNNNVPVKGAVVKLTVGSDVYNITTNGNGVASIIVRYVPGTYTFVSEYGGVSVSSKVTVKSTITASDITGTYSSAKASATFFDADGDVLSRKAVTFELAGVAFEATTDGNGLASLSLASYSPKTYTLISKNPVTGEEKKFKVTISKATPTVSISSIQSGNSVTVKATVTSGVTGNVVFTVGDKTYTRSISNGVATLSLSDLSAGTYSAYAKFNGDSNYNAATSSTIKITISDDKITLIAPDLTMYYGKFDMFNVTVMKGTARLVGATVKLTVGSDEYSLTTDFYGVASIIVKLYPGEYTFVSEYGGQKVSSKVTIKPTVIVTDSSYKFSDAVASATFLDLNGNPVSNKEVSFEIGSGTYIAKTDSKGFASVDVALDSGKYVVMATNPVTGEERYYSLTIENDEYIISVKKLTKVYGDSNQLVVRVLDSNGKPVSKEEVQLDLYDMDDFPYDFFIVNTDANGYAKFKCNVRPGYYDAYVFAGENSVITSVYVKKMASKIIASQKTFKVKSTKKITATLKNAKNSVLKNQKVTLKVNGKTYSGKTNSKGKVTWNLKKLTKRGTFSAVIKYSGSGYYKSTSKTIKIKVK